MDKQRDFYDKTDIDTGIDDALSYFLGRVAVFYRLTPNGYVITRLVY